MKTLFYIKSFILFSLICFLLTLLPTVLLAQQPSIPTEDILEYSLNRLNESVSEVKTKNQWIKREIEALDEKMRVFDQQYHSLLKEKKTLEQKAVQGQVYAEQRKKELALKQKSISRLEQDRSLLLTEQKELQTKISVQEKVLKDLTDTLAAIKADNKTLKAKQDEFDQYISGTRSIPEYDRMLRAIESAQNDLLAKQQQLKKLKAEHSQPLTQLDGLMAEKSRLKDAYQELKLKYEQASVEERNLQEELTSLDEYINRDIQKVAKDVATLDEKRQALEKVLAQAHLKLKNEDVNLTDKYSLESVEQNLRTMRSENKVLKNQLSSLEKSLQDNN